MREARPGPETGEADAQLRLEGVAKTYGRDRRSVRAIEEVTLRVKEGEFLSVVGPSGCGKTTLLKIVAGLVPASRGEVWIGDRAVTGPIQDFGMVFQSPVLLPWRTVVDNVLLPIEMLGQSKRQHAGRARELLTQVGLDGFESRHPAELSGGMQQRVALCRALIHQPRILLMDEPFAAVDEFTRERLNDQLLDLWEATGKTILFVTHNVVEAAYLSDRVAVMTKRPGSLAGIEEIKLPRPRRPEMRYERDLIGHARRIQGLLKVGT